MLFLKACTRCQGDLVLETLGDEAELFCLQCAHRFPHSEATLVRTYGAERFAATTIDDSCALAAAAGASRR